MPASVTRAMVWPSDQPADQIFGPPRLAVLVVGDEGRGDLEVGQEGAGVPGVFRRHQVGFAEEAQGAQGDVFQVADGRGDDVEGSGHG